MTLSPPPVDKVPTGRDSVPENSVVPSLIGSAGLTGAALVGGAVVANGLVLGALMTTGGALLFAKLPKKTRDFIARHHIVTDVALSAGAVFIFGTTVTGLVAGAATGVMVSGGLAIYNGMARPVG